MIDFSNFHIIIDSREQHPWNFQNMVSSVAKLDTGDYSLSGMQDIFCIERKASVSEVANNITEKRFKDVVTRMSKIPHAFLLLEFNLDDIMIYPVGSNVPKKMWDKLKITPKFILKHLIELQLNHNIKVLFCGDSENAEKMAISIMRKVYEYYGQPKTDI